MPSTNFSNPIIMINDPYKKTLSTFSLEKGLVLMINIFNAPLITCLKLANKLIPLLILHCACL